MKQIRRWRIELLMCEVEVIAEGIVEAREATGNHGPSAVQGSTTKQHAVEVLEHTHTSNYMIIVQITYFVALNERNATVKKWSKFVGYLLTCVSVKFCCT